MSKTPLLLGGQRSAEVVGGKGPEQPASSHAMKNVGFALRSEDKKHIQGGGEARHRQYIPEGQRFTADVLSDLAMRLGDAKLAESLAKNLLLPKKAVNHGKKREGEPTEVDVLLPKKAVNHGKKREGEPTEVDVDVLIQQSSLFAIFSRHTTMAGAAGAFSLAVGRFSSGKDIKKRVKDTDLSRAGMALSAAAHRAPHSEAIYATLATRLAGDAQLLLLSDAVKPARPLRTRWRRWRWRPAADGAGRKSRMEQLLVATISSPEPTLPVHTANGGKELIDKRQIMYAVAVALPLTLLASAAGIRVLAGQGAWAAGAGVCLWTLATGGMVINQYGKHKMERFAAKHLNGLCLIGSASLLSFYAFRAYFPAETWAVCLLLGIAVTVLGISWVMSVIRANDVTTADTTKSTGTTGDGQDDLS